MNEREEKLKEIFKEIGENAYLIVEPVISNVVFLENQLDELKKLPFIEVNKKNSAIQRPTTASKMFKELHQQYNNAIKILVSVLEKNEVEEDSPLREFMQQMKEQYND